MLLPAPSHSTTKYIYFPLPAAKKERASVMETKNFVFCFAFRSVCTNFDCIEVRQHLNKAKKKDFFLCFVFGLH